MPIQHSIPVPAEFDTASVDEKRAYLSQLRARLAESVEVDAAEAEDALFAVIRQRKAELEAHPDQGLSLDELMGPLRRKYSGT